MQGLLGFALSTVVKHLDVGTIWIFLKIHKISFHKRTREILECTWKNLPSGSAVVTFGLIVVGFTIGELGKTAKKENISNFKVTHLSVLLKKLGILGGQKEIWRKKKFIFSKEINFYNNYK